MGDNNCSNLETQTWLKLTPTMWEEVERATDKVYGTKTSIAQFNLITVGKFEKNYPDNSSDAWKDRVPYRFELIKIVKAGPFR